MLAEELTIEEADWDVQPIKSQEVQVLFLSYVYFLQLKATMEVHFQLLHEIITK
jgi:hypothetical protein